MHTCFKKCGTNLAAMHSADVVGLDHVGLHNAVANGDEGLALAVPPVLGLDGDDVFYKFVRYKYIQKTIPISSDTSSPWWRVTRRSSSSSDSTTWR